ncbi:helix-turn-helix domain-containing protein [Hydrogenophaga sp. A37]|uniref:helix-turn-helix domain-containing protein n=1 Tax=Hydrogenophaga sp. A37 TaxID=1945864 RepID=UPI00098460DE|nr:helix-turn-helix domain-containing protein [Hydrogenophaga sp. A37]OOG88827.1 histidine kinase [Hydrogenophaga sp. A37]
MIPHTPNPTPSDQRLALIKRARLSVLEARDSAPSPWLAPTIERSWRRCLAQGKDPRQRVSFEPVSAGAMQHALDASRPLVQAAAPVIRSLSRAMVHTRYFAILTDARGTVIGVDGPVDRNNPHAAAIARLGVNLSESAVGTTAIGATLAEHEPVWLHRGEHFFNDTSIFSCAGAPIFGPDGLCVGMLDLTGVDVAEQPALKHLVTQSARSIENALTTARPHRLLLRLNWPGRVLGDDNDGLVCVDNDGAITGANRAAADMLGLSTQRQPLHCGEVFAVPTDTLFDAASNHRTAIEVPLWSGLRLQVLAQSPGSNAAGTARPASHSVPLKDVETALIRRAVEDARGNVMEAARALGISRATVYRKIGKR